MPSAIASLLLQQVEENPPRRDGWHTFRISTANDPNGRWQIVAIGRDHLVWQSRESHSYIAAPIDTPDLVVAEVPIAESHIYLRRFLQAARAVRDNDTEMANDYGSPLELPRPWGTLIRQYAENHPPTPYEEWVTTEDNYLLPESDTYRCQRCGYLFRFMAEEDSDYCESCWEVLEEDREEEREEEESEDGVYGYSCRATNHLDSWRVARGGDDTAPAHNGHWGWIGVELEVNGTPIRELTSAIDGVALPCYDGSLGHDGVELKFPPASLRWYQSQDWQDLLEYADSPASGYGLHIHVCVSGLADNVADRFRAALLCGGSERWRWLCGRGEAAYLDYPVVATAADIPMCPNTHYTVANRRWDWGTVEWRQPASTCRQDRILSRIEAAHALLTWCVTSAQDSNVEQGADCVGKFLRWCRNEWPERYSDLLAYARSHYNDSRWDMPLWEAEQLPLPNTLAAG